jgi:hypothetical protein
VVHSYYDWLADRSLSERLELGPLDPAARLQRVEQLRLTQQYLEASDEIVFSPQDRQTLYRWVQATLVGGDRRGRPADGRLAAELRQVISSDGKSLTAEQLDQLADRLSPAPREALRQAPNLAAQQTLASQWLRTVLRRPGPRMDNREVLRLVLEELDRDPEVRERWTQMPRGRILEELRRRAGRRGGPPE